MSTPPKKLASQVKSIINEEEAASEVVESESEYLEDEVDRSIKFEYLQTLKQNNIERKKYAKHIFFFTCGWSASITVILVLCGLKAWCFYLSDTVLLTLITTTTVNFFGFFLLVTKYLFNAKAIEKPNPFK